MSEARTRNQQIRSIYLILRKERDWLDPADAMDMARDLHKAGYRKAD